ISDDELGTLVDAFNAMLEQIHDRDSALVKSKEAAETASKAKSHFLANINHELRTPLNAIIGFSEIIKNEMLGKLENPKYSSYAKDIYTAGTHLLQLINDILDYSKLESGQIDLSLDTVDLNRTLKTVVRLTMPQATEHRIEILREVAEDPLTIVTDERKLRQVLLNILSNAVKFNPDGGKVTVRAWRDRGRSAVIIEVVDTGIGIAPEDMDTAMAHFGQVESGFNRHYEGTGLGLPLSKKYVQAMGGVFELQSAAGLGTTVTITLPLQPIKGS
ncbi:MAG: HAMP domain-containing histidine kinase, partial [Alphaproteobacteria bacterium]|nr:HAMP domain-containing histidine kinase [Alphaproteobacteria bacterium]